MTFYDIFNGDADGICSLQQLRLVEPRDAELVTGLKRDINLVDRVPARAGDELVVLDVSFDKNREGVRRALDAGARIFYADHHFAGELIDSDRLELHIHTHAETCTSLIVNALLKDAYPGWAVAGAYGDNLYDSADSLAQRLGMSQAQRGNLRELGTCLNYNGYGFELEDLVFHPAELYRLVAPHRSPFDFIETAAYRRLLEAYRHDLEASQGVAPYRSSPQGAIYILPDEPWARRVNGVFSNDLARAHPERAHAVLTPCGAGCYRVSVRAPLARKTGADRLCRQFKSGGGREAAAGINHLDETDLPLFRERFYETFRND